MYSWSWSSSSSSCAGGSSKTKVVQTTIRNGQKVVTTSYSDQPQSVSIWEPEMQVQRRTTTVPSLPVVSAIPATSAKPMTVNQFEQECLDEHNRLRARHGCPPLKLNRNMCTYAAEWAKRLASRRCLEHRTDRKYGENLFMAGGYQVDGKTAVKSWYDEIAQYNYSRPGFRSGTGHFTQVVWKGSKELGVGVERRGDSTWVVANYDPAGNFMGQFEQNVPRPQK